MKTRAIIEFKDTYASMECHNLGYQTKETALAIMSPTGHILSSTPLFRKAYGSKMTHIDQLPFHIDNLTIKASVISQMLKLICKIGLPIRLSFPWTTIDILLNTKNYYTSWLNPLSLNQFRPLPTKRLRSNFQSRSTMNTFVSFRDLFSERLEFTATLAHRQSLIVTPTRRLNGPNSMLMAVRITITDLLFSIATKGYGVASFIKKASLK